MADVFTTAKRSALMARVRSRANGTTEIALQKLLRRHGIKGWRRNQTVFGKPDFIFKSGRVAVFVDGCFWHSCPKHASFPATRRKFWMQKLTANVARDRLVNRTLRADGWRVIRIWEHQLSEPSRVLARLKSTLLDPWI